MISLSHPQSFCENCDLQHVLPSGHRPAELLPDALTHSCGHTDASVGVVVARMLTAIRLIPFIMMQLQYMCTALH